MWNSVNNNDVANYSRRSDRIVLQCDFKITAISKEQYLSLQIFVLKTLFYSFGSKKVPNLLRRHSPGNKIAHS